MKQLNIINTCINSCPFYFNSMDGMECTHPIMLAKGVYAGMIISHGDIIPPKCPLRKESLVVEHRLETKQKNIKENTN